MEILAPEIGFFWDTPSNLGNIYPRERSQTKVHYQSLLSQALILYNLRRGFGRRSCLREVLEYACGRMNIRIELSTVGRFKFPEYIGHLFTG